MNKLDLGNEKIIAAVSTKEDGSCRLATVGTTDKETLERRRKFLLGLGDEKAVAASLVHGKKVAMVSGADKGSIISETDGLLTRDKNVLLAITVADCLPIYLYDREAEAVGLLHAGWRGLERGIIPEAVLVWKTVIGDAAALRAHIGPCIGPCHFEIKEDVRERFMDFPEALKEDGGRIFLDLPAVARNIFEREGVPSENITSAGECTFCLESKYFSYRRDKPETIEAMVAAIGIRD